MWEMIPRQASTGSASEVASAIPAHTTQTGSAVGVSSTPADSLTSLSHPSSSSPPSSTPQTTSVATPTSPVSHAQSTIDTASISSATTFPAASLSLSITSSPISSDTSSALSTSDLTSTPTTFGSTSSSSSITISSSSTFKTSTLTSDTTSSTRTSTLPTSSVSSDSLNTPTSSSSQTITTLTSSIVTTIDGKATTIATVFPTALNSPASTGSNNGSHTGVIAGAAIAGGLVLLLIITGVFLCRRRVRRREALSQRSLPAPRSELLAEDDGVDPAGGPSPQRFYSIPPLVRIRAETGSLFQEGVWPPPGERSRLEDPIRSHVDLSSIVDSVMGMGNDSHGRWSSADSGGSSTPLLDRRADTNRAPPKLLRESALRGTSETTPLNPSGHTHQASIDSNADSPPSRYASLSPDAPAHVTLSRWRSARSTQTTGTLAPTEARSDLSGLGTLVVVNDTPDVEVSESLVDVTDKQAPSSEIPPSYQMIRRDTDDGWKTPLQPTIMAQAHVAEENTPSGFPSGSNRVTNVE